MSDPEVHRPMKMVRKTCLDCSENAKMVMYCPCDGVHSTRCHLWPYRFGIRPESAKRRYGERFVTPELMPDANVCIDDLPMVGVKAQTQTKLAITPVEAIRLDPTPQMS